ncbi:hypothetical protein Taro_017216 [Colocasia esculenta]|uniref:Uncharacterized protein n=1 Tax=Colocasia esculenta TaxID=4460 RepID=A0A843UQT7_COLES|nr:hypothetical protein [Colocasia esculenta]
MLTCWVWGKPLHVEERLTQWLGLAQRFEKFKAKVQREWDGTSSNDAGKGAPVGTPGGELRVTAPVKGLGS